MGMTSEIKHVAIYLRKSRAEADQVDVLSKHRDTLVAYAQQNGWTYKEYEEVVTGEELAQRVKMQALLDDVTNGEYDAILVVEIDRLGRGEDMDWAIIKKTIIDAEIAVVTSHRFYDLAEDTDYKMFDLEAMFARWELKKIKKRFQDGKIRGAKQGKWVNGKPPFPYYYDTTTKSVQVDETKRPYYRGMVEKYLAGENLTEIAKWLTKNMATPYATNTRECWYYETVARLLVSEVHLGYIVYGKSSSKKNNRKYFTEDNWIKAKGDHEALKTQEEHDAIIAKYTQNRNKKPKILARTSPLSGMIVCHQCGRTMAVIRIVEKGIVKYRVRCKGRNDKRFNCKQSGFTFEKEFLEKIYQKVIRIDSNTLDNLQTIEKERKQLEEKLRMKEQELARVEQALVRVHENYEEGHITKPVYLERKASRERQIANIQEEVKQLMRELSKVKNIPNINEVKQQLENFKFKWHLVTSSKEKNVLLKTLVNKIEYDRVGRCPVNLKIYYH